MAVNLAKAGDIELVVHDLRNEPVEELVTLGARRASSPREVGSRSDIIEVIVVDDAQVEAVVLGDEGVVAGAKRGSIVAIHSTIRPATVREIAAACEKRGIGVIDAPVSGGPRGAETRTMCYMAGGDKELVDKCRPIFEVSGDNIFHLGALGAGMIAKLAHQVTICLNVVAARRRISACEESWPRPRDDAGNHPRRRSVEPRRRQLDEAHAFSECRQALAQGPDARARMRRGAGTRSVRAHRRRNN